MKRLTEKEKREIRKNLQLAKIRKQQIEEYKEKMQRLHQEHYWNKEKYLEEMNKEREGRNITEWIQHYEQFITYYKKLLI